MRDCRKRRKRDSSSIRAKNGIMKAGQSLALIPAPRRVSAVSQILSAQESSPAPIFCVMFRRFVGVMLDAAFARQRPFDSLSHVIQCGSVQ